MRRLAICNAIPALGGVGGNQTASADAGRAGRAPVIPMPVPRLMLSDDECAAALGVSTRKWRELADEWNIPPVPLGPRCVRWSLQDLQQAIERAPRQTQRSEPAELARSRIARMRGGE